MRIMKFEEAGTIEYPDSFAFVFNPMRIIVTTTNKVSVTIASLFVDERTPHEGKVELDIASYCQSLFDIDGEKMVQAKEIEVQVATTAASFVFTVTAIWGAINIGEVFNGARRLTWYKNYPCTLSVYLSSGATLNASCDGGMPVAVQAGTGLQHIDLASIFPNAKMQCILSISRGKSAGSTFCYTFDATFRPVQTGERVDNIIDINETKCGVYLRWIDRHGMYCYYLFQEGCNERKTAIAGEVMHSRYRDGRYGYYGVFRRQQMQMQRSVKVCAVLVDRNTAGYLETLLSSPLVDMWVDGSWVPVTVTPASIVDERKSLQDFEVEIVWPEVVTQRL